jgi:hypothetical protein
MKLMWKRRRKLNGTDLYGVQSDGDKKPSRVKV